MSQKVGKNNNQVYRLVLTGGKVVFINFSRAINSDFSLILSCTWFRWPQQQPVFAKYGNKVVSGNEYTGNQ